MSAVALGVAAALVALRCQLISDDPYVLGSVSRVIPATRPAFIEALNRTRRLIGCPVEGDVKPPVGDFVGGQCPTSYSVSATFTRFLTGCTPSASSSGPNTRLGPIGPLTPVGGSPTCPGAAAQGWEVSTASGQLGVASITPRGTTRPVVTVTRIDGLPDDCGSLEGDYPPPTNFTTNIDITYNIDDGTEITVNAPFVFAPITANFDGSLRIPFTFDLGGLEFSGDINLPDFDVTLNPPRLPPGSGDDLTPVGDDDPGDTVPPAPPDEKIIGVVVNATAIDSRRVSSYSSPGIPPIFVPRLGSVKFVYSIGAATFFSSDIDIKDARTFIPCPFSQGADAVIASPNLGVNLTFVPIRGYPLATTSDIVNAA